MNVSRLTGLLFFGVLCSSCQYFQTERISSETFYEEELKSMNWNEIDTYPAFPNCESLTEKEMQQECFQKIITEGVKKRLLEQRVVVHQTVRDTLRLFLEVNKEGALSLLNMEADSLLLQQIPTLQTLLQESIKALPTPAPAYKRGIPVTAHFTLPVAISSRASKD